MSPLLLCYALGPQADRLYLAVWHFPGGICRHSSVWPPVAQEHMKWLAVCMCVCVCTSEAPVPAFLCPLSVSQSW